LRKLHEVKKVLANRESKHVENDKSSLFLFGRTHSQLGKLVLAQLCKLKPPHLVKKLTRSNDIQPFEPDGTGLLESLARKSDCSLFAMATHSKKRPHNLILGRLFDFAVLDMIEFGVHQLLEPHQFKEISKLRPNLGSKPCLVFDGDDWDASSSTSVMKSLFLDFFRGETLDYIDVGSLDRVLVLTLDPLNTPDSSESLPRTIYLRQYYPKLMKNAATPKVPRVCLEEIGPRVELVSRRTRFASAALNREAYRQSKKGKERKVKNISKDDLFGDTVGRIHVGKQSLDSLVLAKPKGLRRSKGNSSGNALNDESSDEDNQEDDEESNED